MQKSVFLIVKTVILYSILFKIQNTDILYGRVKIYIFKRGHFVLSYKCLHSISIYKVDYILYIYINNYDK